MLRHTPEEGVTPGRLKVNIKTYSALMTGRLEGSGQRTGQGDGDESLRPYTTHNSHQLFGFPPAPSAEESHMWRPEGP